jgi:hypothetical protein
MFTNCLLSLPGKHAHLLAIEDAAGLAANTNLKQTLLINKSDQIIGCKPGSSSRLYMRYLIMQINVMKQGKKPTTPTGSPHNLMIMTEKNFKNSFETGQQCKKSDIPDLS